MNDLVAKLNTLLCYVEDADPTELSQARITNELEACVDMAEVLIYEGEL